MPLPSCEQFDMAKCADCPLKNMVARYMVYNQAAGSNGGVEPQDFALLAESLTMADYDKFKMITNTDTENNYYTVDDRACEDGPFETTDWTMRKQECGAEVVPVS